MAAPAGDVKDGKAFYGYLFTKAQPFPAPTPVLEALLKAIALHIVRYVSWKPGHHQPDRLDN
jgi:hypothetical protein